MKPIINIESLYKQQDDLRIFKCSGDFFMAAFRKKKLIGWLLGETGNSPIKDYKIIDRHNLIGD